MVMNIIVPVYWLLAQKYKKLRIYEDRIDGIFAQPDKWNASSG